MKSNKIRLLGNPVTVFSDYYKPSLYIPIGVTCCGKCWKEQNKDSDTCQNWNLSHKEFSLDSLLSSIFGNKLVDAYVMSGKEPFDNFDELINLIDTIRQENEKDIIIYTGYNRSEVLDKLDVLKKFVNIVIKFGRFIIDSSCRYDEVLQIKLNSENQYAEKIS